MSVTILVEDDSKLRKLYELNLNLYVGTKVVHQHNADDVIEYIKKKNKVNLIVSEPAIGDENTILKIYYFIKSQKLNVPIILLGENIKLQNEVTQIENTKWQQVIKQSAKFLGMTAEKMNNLKVPDYYPIPTRNFLPINVLSCDIYMNDPKARGQNLGFAKLIKANVEYETSIIEKAILDGVEKLFVLKENRLKFVNAFSDQVAADVNKVYASKDDQMMSTANSFYAAKEMINLTGLTDRALTLAKRTVDDMSATVSSCHGLADLWEILERNKLGYVYQHCLMISLMAHYAIPKMEWGTKEQQTKICFVSFFHDITIPEEHLAKIKSEDELAAADLSEEDEDRVMRHSQKAAELLKDYPRFPFGSEMIILQHHGALNGYGFTERLDSRITPLAIVFRVIEDYVNELLEQGKDHFDKKQILIKLKKKYDKGQYRKVIAALGEVK